MPILAQGGNQTHLLPRCQLRKNMDFFNGCAKYCIRHLIHLRTCQHRFGGNPYPAADGNCHICLVSRQNLRGNLQPFERLHRGFCGFLRCIKKGKIAHQNHALFILRQNPILLFYPLSCNSNHLHPILQHFIHHRGHASHLILIHRQNGIPIFHKAAARHNMRNIPLDNELPCSVCLRHKRADKFTGIIKWNLVRFLILRKQSCIIRTAPRHCLARKNCIINGIADTRMIYAVQKGKIQHPCAFVP